MTNCRDVVGCWWSRGGRTLTSALRTRFALILIHGPTVASIRPQNDRYEKRDNLDIRLRSTNSGGGLQHDREGS